MATLALVLVFVVTETFVDKLICSYKEFLLMFCFHFFVNGDVSNGAKRELDITTLEYRFDSRQIFHHTKMPMILDQIDLETESSILVSEYSFTAAYGDDNYWHLKLGHHDIY
jgi:hypothetical protein